MTTRYVGAGGSDSSDGLSWANRKLTLNGVEDTPVVAGDTVYVGPGTYREMLTCDVTGTGGNIITYIGDVTGAFTDGIGGEVRITGSDNDTTATRTSCIYATGKSYRTFQGFSCDMTSSSAILLTGNPSYCIVQDCHIQCITGHCIEINGTGSNNTVRRCLTWGHPSYYGVMVTAGTLQSNKTILIENCIMIGGYCAVDDNRVGGIIVKNCTAFATRYYAFGLDVSLTAGQTYTVNNCLLITSRRGFYAATLGDMVENYNALWGLQTARTNVNVGANSNTYPCHSKSTLLLSGYDIRKFILETANYSPVRQITGTGEATDDFFGITRPTTSSKKSWGAVQYQPISRSTTQTYGSSTSSLKFSDAGRWQMRVPVTAVSTTFSVRVYRETNYAGTLPQMLIKQDGQSTTTVTDVGSAATWNLLTTTLTPAANPGWITIELVSDNTATSGSYAVYFDVVMVA